MTKGVYRRTSPAETSRKLGILKELQALTLKEKMKISVDIINKSVDISKNSCLLFSGGKDSTVLMHLLKSQNVDFFAMYNNTTLGDPSFNLQLQKIVEKIGVEYVETTADDPVKMWKEKGYYPILTKRGHNKFKKLDPTLRISPVQCCYQLKEKYCNVVLKKRGIKVVYWGNRASESNRRKFSFVDNGFLFKPKKYAWHQCYPLQHWTNEDIKQYLNINIPWYNVDSTLESGCLCCATDIQFKHNTLKKLHDSDYEKWLYYIKNGFGEQILKIKGIKPEKLDEIIQTKPQVLFRI